MTDPHDLTDRLAALESDNARLRRLLDEAGAHEGLRHGVRDTVALLREIIRQTAENAADVESYAAHLAGRLDAIVRVRGRVDAFGEADLHSVISDELAIHLVLEGERAMLAGPGIQLRPKPAQAFALAIHELASNAIEHGVLGGRDGHVDVTWQVQTAEAGQTLGLVWKEVGATGSIQPSRNGFGTAVLKELLVYHLSARTSLAYETDGLRCTITIPLTARVGRLV